MGVTAMVAAVYVDSLRILRDLMDRGGDPSVVHCSVSEKENDVDSLLSTACFAGSMECANFLLSMETRPQYRGKALMWVITGGDEAFVRRLLYESLPVSEGIFCSSASRASSGTMLDLLLTWGCQHYGIECLTQAFLSLCAGYRYAFSGPAVPMDLLPVYLAHVMDPNAGRGSKSALAMAIGGIYGSRPEIVRLLVENGADLNSDDSQGRTALAIVEDFLLFFDGGSRGNPRPGGAGSVVVHTDTYGGNATIVWSAAMSLANATTTNNQAEYLGLIHGLAAAKSNHWLPLEVIGDSTMIIAQL